MLSLPRALFVAIPLAMLALATVPVAAQTTLLGNARATDISKIEAELSTMMGATAAGPYLRNLGPGTAGQGHGPSINS